MEIDWSSKLYKLPATPQRKLTDDIDKKLLKQVYRRERQMTDIKLKSESL